MVELLLLGSIAGSGAGLLAGLIGIGGGIVVVPVIFYGLAASGVPADAAAHIAVATSLAAILPASIVSFLGHWRAGNTDLGFLIAWGPAIAAGVVAAQLTAPHVRGVVLSAVFGFLCLVFAIRFAFPNRSAPCFGSHRAAWFDKVSAPSSEPAPDLPAPAAASSPTSS